MALHHLEAVNHGYIMGHGFHSKLFLREIHVDHICCRLVFANVHTTCRADRVAPGVVLTKLASIKDPVEIHKKKQTHL